MRKFVLSSLAVLASAVMALAQTLQVQGTVKDASGAPVPSATVSLNGAPSNYIVSDFNGAFFIKVPADGTLKVECYGYKTSLVPVAGRKTIDIVLEDALEQIEETIVVAFGTSTKEAFTGSAKVLDSEELAKSPVTNVTNALAGSVAGVQLTSANGAPGSQPTIRIRGFSSINAGNSPLVIVDGAPYEGDINNISPNDVESMTVLKDAASNALYGARGANGVIMITTKKAKKGQPNVTFDVKYGFNNNSMQEYETIKDPSLHYETHAKALYNYYVNEKGMDHRSAIISVNSAITSSQGNGGLGYQIYDVPEGQFFINNDLKVNPRATLGNVYSTSSNSYYLIPDDWAKAAYRNGAHQEYSLSVSGSEGKVNYYSSINYLVNEGIVSNSNENHLSARIKADYQAKDWLKVGMNMSYSHFSGNYLTNNGTDGSTGNIFAFTSSIAPIYPLWVRNADGSIKVDSNGISVMDYGNGNPAKGGVDGISRPFISDANALQQVLLNTNYQDGNQFNGNAFADINIFKDLKLTVNATVYNSEVRANVVYNPYYGQFVSTKGLVEIEHDRYTAINAQQILEYSHKFGKHNVNVIAGHEYFDYNTYVLYAAKNNMFSQDNKELNGAIIDSQSAGSYRSEYNNEGFLARALYDYDSKYYFSASFRRDASSNFAPENRWGNFWSVGGSWLVNKESWFQAGWVDELKVKASIGSQGNDNIGSYRYTDTYSLSNSDGQIGIDFNTKGNRNITWETNTNMNAGVEFALFNNRLSGSVDFFNRKTTDMLFSFTVAPTMGYSSYYDNIGDMSNKGVELDLTYYLVDTKNFQWSINGNITWLQNRITKLADEKKTTTVYDVDGNAYKGYADGSFFIAEGLPMYTYYTYQYQGVNENGQATYARADAETHAIKPGADTTNYTSGTRFVMPNRSTIAPVYGGFGTSVKAYGVDFSINFSYQVGGYMYDSGYASLMTNPTGDNHGSAFHVDILDAWTPENTSSDIPRWQYLDKNIGSISSRYLTNASYLNLQNISLGYTLPSKWTDSVLKNGSFRVYATAENVYFWSSRKGFDPRVSYSGTGASYYSPMRTVLVGATVKF